MTDKLPDEQPNAAEVKSTDSAAESTDLHDESEAEAIKSEDLASDSDVTGNEESVKEAKPVSSSETAQKKSGGWGKLILVVVVLLLCVSGMFAAGWYWVNEKFARLDANFEEKTQGFADSSALVEMADSLSSELSPVREDNVELKKQIDYLQQKIQSQNLRILSMSTTSREDWLLAEAEYLLKLANQRILIEKNAGTAIGLLEEADAILRDLSDPDLFQLRKALKDDLVALKLAKEVDLEGIYLELSALAENVTSLPLVPESYSRTIDEPPETTEPKVENASIFERFLNSFSGYVRVIRHDEKPEAILPPDDTKYLHLNLQFMFERAQIALLREQQDIYLENLSRAKTWVVRYFSKSRTSEQFMSQIDQLLDKDIVIDLPDISGSLALIHEYIDAMHAKGRFDEKAEESDKEDAADDASSSSSTEEAL